MYCVAGADNHAVRLCRGCVWEDSVVVDHFAEFEGEGWEENLAERIGRGALGPENSHCLYELRKW
jgi:hypothetical protein